MGILGAQFMGLGLILRITPNKYGSLPLFKDGVQSEVLDTVLHASTK
jgi:hypothetical protein